MRKCRAAQRWLHNLEGNNVGSESKFSSKDFEWLSAGPLSFLAPCSPVGVRSGSTMVLDELNAGAIGQACLWLGRVRAVPARRVLPGSPVPDQQILDREYPSCPRANGWQLNLLALPRPSRNAIANRWLTQNSSWL